MITVEQLVQTCTNTIESIEIYNINGKLLEARCIGAIADEILDAEVKTWNLQNDDAKLYILV